jgi:hypothetical protein
VALCPDESTVYAARDGIQVTLYENTWTRHIQARRPDVTKNELVLALGQAVRIYADTSFPNRRVYQGATRTTGFFRNSFLLVVVALTDEHTGRVVTAFLTEQPYQGRQLWPPTVS